MAIQKFAKAFTQSQTKPELANSNLTTDFHLIPKPAKKKKIIKKNEHKKTWFMGVILSLNVSGRA